MSTPVQHILALAAELDREAQWELMRGLTALMQQQEAEGAPLPPKWQEELTRRVDALDAGDMTRHPWRKVLDELRNRGA